VRGAETIKEMQHRNPPGQGRSGRNRRHVLRFLYRIGGKQRETGAARRHHIGMVTKNRQRMRRHGAGGNMKDGRRQFAGNLVHIGNHQQQSLRGGKGRRQRPTLQCTMNGTGGTTFRLQFNDPRNRPPDIGPPLRRPFVRQLAHPGGRGNRINGDYFRNAIRHIGNGLIAVDS